MNECKCGRPLHCRGLCRRCYEAELRYRKTKAIKDEAVLQLVSTVANVEETARLNKELRQQLDRQLGEQDVLAQRVEALAQRVEALSQRVEMLERRQRPLGNLSAVVMGLCRRLKVAPRKLVDGTTDGL